MHAEQNAGDAFNFRCRDVKMCNHEALKIPQTQSLIVCVCSRYTDVATHMLLGLLSEIFFCMDSKKIDML